MELSYIAESFIGKNFITKSNNPEIGMDCLGLIYFSMIKNPQTKEIGEKIQKKVSFLSYNQIRNIKETDKLISEINKDDFFIYPENYKKNDILVLKEKRNISHFAIVDDSGKNIIHSSFFKKKVIKTEIDSEIEKKIYRILRFNN